MKFFTAYKVNFSRKELGLADGDMTGNPYLRNNNSKDKYNMGSHISEEEDDEFNSTRRNFWIFLTLIFTVTFLDSLFRNKRVDDTQRVKFLRGSIEPKNVLYVDEANHDLSADRSILSTNKLGPNNNSSVFITKSIGPLINSLEHGLASDNKKERPRITLNVRIPKDKLEALKHISAII
jgi:hypothetical protein